MTATIGTIPAMTLYQPGALPITGEELVEIASSGNATTAATYAALVKDLIGKAPSIMSAATPQSADMIVMFRPGDGLYYSGSIGNINVPAGNLPIGGATGALLSKLSPTDFDATWSTISAFVAGQTSVVTVVGTASIVVGIATAGIGSTQLGTNAVQNVNIRQGSALSVIGVAGSALANVADIAASGGTQVLQSNAGGTGLLFTSILPALPGPLQVTSLPLGVIIGLGTSAMTSAPVTAPGALLVDQGTAAVPIMRAIGGDLSMSLAGTATIATAAVAYQKIQTTVGLSVIGVVGTASALNTAITGGTGMVLAVSPTGTTLGFSGRVGLGTALLVGSLASAAAIATGNVAASSYLQSYGGFKIATSAFSIATTTFANVTNLTAALNTASTYWFESCLYVTAGSTGGSKVTVNSTGTASIIVFDAQGYNAGGALAGGGRATALGSTILISTSAVAPTITIVGTITTNNAGTLAIQVAQQASTTTSTVVAAGSSLKVFQIAP